MVEEPLTDRREMNGLLLNNLSELNIEIRELRTEVSEQYRYLNKSINDMSNTCQCTTADIDNKYIRTGIFWKVTGFLFALVCGSYTYITYMLHIKH
jgi:hypothetical protein